MKVSFVFPAEVIASLTIRNKDDLLCHIGAIVERVLAVSGFNVKNFYSSMAEYQTSDCDMVYPLMMWPKTTLGMAFSNLLEHNIVTGKDIHVNVIKVNIPQRPDTSDYIVKVRE